MKRIFSVGLCCGLLITALGGCATHSAAHFAKLEDFVSDSTSVPPESVLPSASPSASPMDAMQIAQAIVTSQPDNQTLLRLWDEECQFYVSEQYGLEDKTDEAVLYTASGVDGREIAILHPAEGVSPDDLTAGLESYREARHGDFFGYAPQEAALLEQAEVVTGGGYTALLVCDDMDAALETFSACTSGTFEVPPTPTPKHLKNLYPFNPPNEVDMTLYDTSQIRAAWETGDASSLNEKDAAIFARCQEVFAACIQDGMTPFEKEVALHDWLINWGHYDETALDHKVSSGQPDNNNPYGMLVNGYGICLGYATTFQLLMDLANIECITVIGAAHQSTEDHAWNMVRLDGEWYCVDATWDDPVGDFPENKKIHYRYFNVTTQKLLDSNHQWDYASVPEATADRWYWDGVSARPS